MKPPKRGAYRRETTDGEISQTDWQTSTRKFRPPRLYAALRSLALLMGRLAEESGGVNGFLRSVRSDCWTIRSSLDTPDSLG